MPPPNFSTTTPGGQQQQMQVPKATQPRIKDAIARIRACLGAGSRTDLEAANKAVQTLINDPNIALDAGADSQQLRNQISTKFNSDLVDVFLKEMDQRDPAKLAYLVEFLSQLGTFLGPTAIVMEWWDLVLRPILKDPTASDRLAGQARELVILAATATPASAYRDEAPPKPSWPLSTEPIQARKAGDAPYPRQSAEPISAPKSLRASQQTSPNSKDRKASSLAHRVAPSDAHYRFAQRLFDLYLQEASAPLGRDESDDEQLDALEELQASTGSLDEQASAPGPPSSAYMWQRAHTEATKPADLAATAWRGNLEAILITFGSERPKEFFHHLSASYDEPLHRIPILLLLTIFLRLYSIHCYHITKTTLLQNIALSLQLDTSTTLIALCITGLIIVIPHIPDWIANGGAGGVPVMLSIYARIVDWRKLGPGWENRVGEGEQLDQLRRQFDEEFTEIDRLSKRLAIRPEFAWRRLESSVDTDLTATPNATRFFTIIYGLFPCNTLRFLRAPIDYLRKANYQSPLEADWEELIDEGSVQLRSEPTLRKHTLARALVDSTAEKEITDKQRWASHDAADITAECICLSIESWMSVAVAGGRQPGRSLVDVLIGQGPSDIEDEREPSHAASSTPTTSNPVGSALMNKVDDILSSYTQLRWGETLPHNGGTLSPGSASPLSPSSRSTSQAGRMLRSVTVSSMGSGPLSPDGSTSPTALSPSRPSFSSTTTLPGTRGRPLTASADWAPSLRSIFGGANAGQSRSVSGSAVLASKSQDRSEKPAARQAVYAEVKYLQRENLLLRNELNFELFHKEQHLRHIGRLHRDRIAGSALEAERQNLYQTVKSLRSQVAALTTNQDRQRAETSTTKARHAQWETELNSKLKSFREERRAWTNESRDLKAHIEDLQATIDVQHSRLDDSSSELFELRTELDALRPKVEKLYEYERKTLQLTKCLTYWDDDVRKYEAQRREMEEMLSGWRGMEMVLEAADEDRWRLEAAQEEANLRAERAEKDIQALRTQHNAQEERHQAQLASATAKPKAAARADGDDEALQRRLEDLETEVLMLRARAEAAESSLQKHSDARSNTAWPSALDIFATATESSVDVPSLSLTPPALEDDYETPKLSRVSSSTLQELRDSLATPASMEGGDVTEVSKGKAGQEAETLAMQDTEGQRENEIGGPAEEGGPSGEGAS